MPEIEAGGLTVTTNTGSEADLRQSLEMPAPAAPDAAPPPTAPPAPAERPRDDQGRFAKAEASTPPVETPPPPSDTPPPDDVERRPGLPTEEVEAESRRHPLVRMRKALEQKAAAERRAAAAEAALAQAIAYAQAQTGQTPPQAAPTDPRHAPEPTFEQFAQEPDPYTAFMQAWTRWDNHRTVTEAVTQARTEWQVEQQARQRAEVLAQNLARGRTAYPDWDQTLTTADTLGLQVSAAMRDAIAESPRAADLVHFLATHPDECMRIAMRSESMPVTDAWVMQEYLESKLGPHVAASNGAGTATRPATSTAKPPVTPVGSSPVVSDAPPGDDASAAEHAKYWNRKLKVPGARY